MLVTIIIQNHKKSLNIKFYNNAVITVTCLLAYVTAHTSDITIGMLIHIKVTKKCVMSAITILLAIRYHTLVNKML